MTQENTTKAITVEGLTVTIDPARLKSWKAVEMQAEMQKAQQASDQMQVALLSVEFFRYVLGDEYVNVIQYCGGEYADAEHVAWMITQIIEQVVKNP